MEGLEADIEMVAALPNVSEDIIEVCLVGIVCLAAVGHRG